MESTDDVRFTIDLDEAYRRELATGNALAETTFEILVDDTYLIGGPVGEQHEPVVLFVSKVLDGLDAVFDGEERWFGCYSLPGGLRVTPAADGVVHLWFGHAEGFNADVPEAGLPVDSAAFVDALLEAARNLLEFVHGVESATLQENRYVERLEESVATAERRYRG